MCAAGMCQREQAGMPNAGPKCQTPGCRTHRARMPNGVNALSRTPECRTDRPAMLNSVNDQRRLSSSAAVTEQLSSRKFAQRIRATYVGSVCSYCRQTMVNYLSSRARRYKNIQVSKKTCYTVMEFKRKQSVREIFPCGSCWLGL